MPRWLILRSRYLPVIPSASRSVILPHDDSSLVVKSSRRIILINKSKNQISSWQLDTRLRFGNILSVLWGWMDLNNKVMNIKNTFYYKITMPECQINYLTLALAFQYSSRILSPLIISPINIRMSLHWSQFQVLNLSLMYRMQTQNVHTKLLIPQVYIIQVHNLQWLNNYLIW